MFVGTSHCGSGQAIAGDPHLPPSFPNFPLQPQFPSPIFPHLSPSFPFSHFSMMYRIMYPIWVHLGPARMCRVGVSWTVTSASHSDHLSAAENGTGLWGRGGGGSGMDCSSDHLRGWVKMGVVQLVGCRAVQLVSSAMRSA